MAWVAFDRAIRDVERFGLDGPADRWRAARDEVASEVLERGFDPEAGSFMQSYGSSLLDASLLMIPLVGFLPAEDDRVLGTIAAIEQRLVHDGFVYRYEHDPAVDGLDDREASFLACTFWYADCLNLLGRHDEAVAVFERALGVQNDVGLLAEQYDPSTRTMLGNFPQALSHVSLIDTAHNLTAGPRGPAERRRHPPDVHSPGVPGSRISDRTAGRTDP
jgi:GH15 family glucan-1,4-alpha-glucosidase